MCTTAGAICTKAATSLNKILFPIPETQRQANPLLVQNPGY
jgi:hypothetical protein